MGLLDTMKQADEQQLTTETLVKLTSRLPAVEQQLSKLTKTVADLTGFVKVMDEQQDLRLKRLSTSQQHEQPSTLPLDDETRNRLNEIEKTLSAIASQLSSSETVKLPDGSSVRRSDLDAHTMMMSIIETLATTSRTSAELAEAVRRRGRVVIDTAKLEQHAVKVLDARLAKAVGPSTARIESTLSGFEQRIAAAGAQRASDAAREVEGFVVRAEGVVEVVRDAERRIDALSARVTWTAVGRMCLALLPLTAVLLVLGGLTMGVSHALGFGPLLGWAWSSFSAATLWWQKALIALATLTGVGGFGTLVLFCGRWTSDKYRRW